MRGANAQDHEYSFGVLFSTYMFPGVSRRRLVAMTTQATTDRPASVGWRTPAVVVICGCLIAMLAFGPRSSLGLFPDADVPGIPLGPRRLLDRVRHPELLLGHGPAFAGGVADRFGANRVIIAGAVLYALGLALMARATTPASRSISPRAC